jgi:hypothetical protein
MPIGNIIAILLLSASSFWGLSCRFRQNKTAKFKVKYTVYNSDKSCIIKTFETPCIECTFEAIKEEARRQSDNIAIEYSDRGGAVVCRYKITETDKT